MTAPLTLADLRDAMRSAKACGEHARYRDPQGAEGAAAVFAPDCDACCDAVALAVAEPVREACAQIIDDNSEATDLHRNRRRLDTRLVGSLDGTAYAAAIREWRPT